MSCQIELRTSRWSPRLLKQLEEQPFKSARLAALRSRLHDGRTSASRVIRRLQRLSEILDAQKNAALVPLIFFLYGKLEIALGLAALLQLVRPHVALAVGSWRTQSRRPRADVDQWHRGLRGSQLVGVLPV